MNDWVCGNCKSINRAAANSCYSCGGPREIVAASETRLTSALSGPSANLATADGLGGIAAIGAVGPSAGTATGLMGDGSAGEPASTNDILGGFIAGLIAAILATGIWYGVVAVSQYQLGIVAIAVGFIVGQGVILGANRRGSIVLVAISVALTLLALVVSEYLIVAHFVGQELGAGVTLDLVQGPDFIVSIVIESLQADPLTIAFWAIALFQAFVIPSRLLGRRSA